MSDAAVVRARSTMVFREAVRTITTDGHFVVEMSGGADWSVNFVTRHIDVGARDARGEGRRRREPQHGEETNGEVAPHGCFSFFEARSPAAVASASQA